MTFVYIIRCNKWWWWKSWAWNGKKYKTKCCDHRDFLSFTFHNPNIQFDVTTRHCSCYLIVFTCNSGLLGSQFKKLVNKCSIKIYQIKIVLFWSMTQPRSKITSIQKYKKYTGSDQGGSERDVSSKSASSLDHIQ